MQDRTKNVIQSTSAGVATGVAMRATAGYIFSDTNLCQIIVPPLFSKPITYTPAITEAISATVNQEFNVIRDTIWPWLNPYPHLAVYSLWAGNGLGTSVTKTALTNMTHYAFDIAPLLLKESAMQICGDYMKAASIIPTILWWSAAAGVAGGLYYTLANQNNEPEDEPEKKSNQPVIEDAVKPAELNQKNRTPQLIAEVHIDTKSPTSSEPVSAPETKKRLTDAAASSAARKAKLLSFHHEFGQTQKSLSPDRKENATQSEGLNTGFAL